MDAATRSEVTRLLKRGLNHYGLGDLDAAIGCWEKARSLDPENQAVRDYLETAYEEAERAPASRLGGSDPEGFGDEDDTPRSFPDVARSGADAAADPLLAQALESYKSGHLLEAHRDLQALAREDPERLDVRGYLELVRKQLMQQWAGEIGDRGRSLRLTISQEDLLRQDLKPREAFLLTQVDGFVSIDDLISVSSSDRFQTLEMIARFIRQGILT